MYTYFKLTKEFSTAISNGESIPLLFSLPYSNRDADFLVKEETTDQRGTELISSKREGKRPLFPFPGSDADFGSETKPVLKASYLLSRNHHVTFMTLKKVGNGRVMFFLLETVYYKMDFSLKALGAYMASFNLEIFFCIPSKFFSP